MFDSIHIIKLDSQFKCNEVAVFWEFLSLSIIYYSIIVCVKLYVEDVSKTSPL